jgi:hypothetical protein
MSDSTNEQNELKVSHTRREFIKEVLRKSGYIAPVVATFSVAGAMKAEGASSNNSRRPSQPPGQQKKSGGGGDGKGLLGGN